MARKRRGRGRWWRIGEPWRGTKGSATAHIHHLAQQLPDIGASMRDIAGLLCSQIGTAYYRPAVSPVLPDFKRVTFATGCRRVPPQKSMRPSDSNGRVICRKKRTCELPAQDHGRRRGHSVRCTSALSALLLANDRLLLTCRPPVAQDSWTVANTRPGTRAKSTSG